MWHVGEWAGCQMNTIQGDHSRRGFLQRYFTLLLVPSWPSTPYDDAGPDAPRASLLGGHGRAGHGGARAAAPRAATPARE